MTEEDVKRIVRETIRQELGQLNGGDRFYFDRIIDIGQTANIKISKTDGLKIGTDTSEKIGFFNKTPVDQPATVGDATGCTGNADEKVNELIDRLQELGLKSVVVLPLGYRDTENDYLASLKKVRWENEKFFIKK